MEQPEISEYEKAARDARARYSPATVSLLQSIKSRNNSVKAFTGNAFVIKLDDHGGCKLITCQHVVQMNLEDEDHELWARFYGASEDVRVTIDHYNEHKDIAILNVAELPDTPKGPIVEVEFSRNCKVGTIVTLLGYFNPESFNQLIGAGGLIAKNPNAVPGNISGKLVLDSNHPEENWLLPVDCYGIHGSCGSPIISKAGKVVAMFKQSIEQIHFGIATRTIREQLREWLQLPEATLEEMIEAL